MRAATTSKAKIANAEQMKVHHAARGLVIGNRDLEANAVSVRVHGKGNQKRRRLWETVGQANNFINLF